MTDSISGRPSSRFTPWPAPLPHVYLTGIIIKNMNVVCIVCLYSMFLPPSTAQMPHLSRAVLETKEKYKIYNFLLDEC